MKKIILYILFFLPFMAMSQTGGYKHPSKTQVELDALTPTTGEIFYNTTTGTHVQWDGTAYVPWGGSVLVLPAGASIDNTETIPVGDSTATVQELDRYIIDPDYFTIATGHGLVVGDLINYNNNQVNLAHYDSTHTGGVVDSFPQAMVQKILSGASFDTIYAVNRGQVTGVFTSSDAGKWVVMGADGKPHIPTNPLDSIKVGFVAPNGAINVDIDPRPIVNNITNTTTQYVSTGEVVTMAASVALDGGNANVKTFVFNMGAVTNLTISAFTNTMQWGQYNFFFHSASNETVTFPSGFLLEDGTTMTTLSVPTGRVVSMVYDGTNFRTTAN